MDAKQQQNLASENAPLGSAAPLSPIEARHAKDEARHLAATTGREFFQLQRHGRVEAETRRISEEVTREAQARLHAAQPGTASPAGERSPGAPGRQAAEVPTSRLPPPIAIRHLAIALDGSAFAERALPYATALARLTGAQLTLVHVDTSPSGLDTVIQSTEAAATRRQSEPIAAYCAELRQHVQLPRQRTRVAIRRAPSPAQGLLALEEEGLADVVVIATHARQGLPRALQGSITDQLLRTGRSPVLAVPPLVVPPSSERAICSHALIPLDGSLLSEQALGALGGLIAQESGAEHALKEITLLTVVEHPALIGDAESYLAAIQRDIAEKYVAQGIAIHGVTAVGDAAAVIASVIPRALSFGDMALFADVLVLATHGRGGLGRWLLGSIAAEVMTHTRLPVLLVHPLDAAA
jgi:nucleotide-binding universal stress UspA family protein